MVTKDMLIGEILDKYPQTADHFLAMGMHCLGCPMSRGESIEEACEVHGVKCEEIVAKINKYFEEKEN